MHINICGHRLVITNIKKYSVKKKVSINEKHNFFSLLKVIDNIETFLSAYYTCLVFHFLFVEEKLEMFVDFLI